METNLLGPIHGILDTMLHMVNSQIGVLLHFQQWSGVAFDVKLEGCIGTMIILYQNSCLPWFIAEINTFRINSGQNQAGQCS